MKTLFIGGVKSGKSLKAQNYILRHSSKKPTYLATTEFFDEEMKIRVDKHIKQRKDYFITIEEPLNLYEEICASKGSVLVECVSMWINNMLYYKYSFEDMDKEINKILDLKQDVVFVLNDVGCGIIPENKLAREFIDISGKLSQAIGSRCDEVYHCIAGIATKIK